MLHSIQRIQKVYDTGDKPVLVECNDLNAYVCKHNRGQNPATKLFAEWISYALLKELGVALAPKALVEIKEEHITPSGNCQPAFFKNIPLFATLHLDEALEWSQFKLKEQKLILNKRDILTIAFFDLWMANEDRHWNNFNLLTNPIEKGFEIIPIDHAACLNSLGFNEQNELFGLSHNETIIDTEEFRTLVKPMLKSMKDTNDFIESVYLCMPDLEKIYDEQVIAMPSEWNIPESYSEALKANIFHKEWLSVTKSQFLSFIKSSLQLK